MHEFLNILKPHFNVVGMFSNMPSVRAIGLTPEFDEPGDHVRPSYIRYRKRYADNVRLGYFRACTVARFDHYLIRLARFSMTPSTIPNAFDSVADMK